MIAAAVREDQRRIHPKASSPAAPIRLMPNNHKNNTKMSGVEGHRSMLHSCNHNSVLARKAYMDHKKDAVVIHEVIPHRGATRQFPNKLYEMLAQASKEGFDDIVSWQPHGRAFLVRKPEAFVSEVMHRYYSQSKLTSYQRQLSLYGFVRITSGKDRGAYFHELFLRGRPDLLACIDRKRVKGTGSKQPASPETDPDFYTMEFCHEPGCETEASDGGQDIGEDDEADQDPTTTASHSDGDLPSSNEATMDQHVQDSASMVSEDESLEAFAASFYEENFAAAGDGALGPVPHSAPKVRTTAMRRSAADLCEAEMLAEFGHDLFDEKELALPLAKAAATMCVSSSLFFDSPCAAIKPSTKIGPLRVPGQLRNAFGSGIKSTCVHTTMGAHSGAVVKYILLDEDMSANWKCSEEEYERFRKPLDKAIVFHALDHVNWECYKTEETTARALITDSDSSVLHSDECVSSWTSDALLEQATAEKSSLNSMIDESASSSGPTASPGDTDLEEKAAIVSSNKVLAV